MAAPSQHTVHDLYLKWWLLLGGRAYGPYATAPIMTLGLCDLDLQNDLDLCNDLDLDFQWLLQARIQSTTCP